MLKSLRTTDLIVQESKRSAFPSPLALSLSSPVAPQAEGLGIRVYNQMHKSLSAV